MKAYFAMALGLTAFVAASAVAVVPLDGPNRPVVSKVRQSVGTPHKASSFAPNARAKRRVYGAPIQHPLFTHNTARKPFAPR
jgi:hypothetical protein